MITDKLLRLCLIQAFEADSVLALKPHAGKVLQIRMGPAIVNLRIDPTGMPTVVHSAVTNDAWVELPLERLSGNTTKPVQSAGDSELLAAFSAVVAEADIGVDAWAERVLGPAAGGVAASVGTGFKDWATDSSKRLGATTLAWLTTESGILPEPHQARVHAAEIKQFTQAVDELRQRVTATGQVSK